MTSKVRKLCATINSQMNSSDVAIFNDSSNEVSELIRLSSSVNSSISIKALLHSLREGV
jgi:hypothetical protein